MLWESNLALFFIILTFCRNGLITNFQNNIKILNFKISYKANIQHLDLWWLYQKVRCHFKKRICLKIRWKSWIVIFYINKMIFYINKMIFSINKMIFSTTWFPFSCRRVSLLHYQILLSKIFIIKLGWSTYNFHWYYSIHILILEQKCSPSYVKVKEMYIN